MSIVRAVFLATALVASLSAAPTNNKATEWWQTTTIYQIYPRSFKDSNNDGIGDLKGIIDKLSHFVETGIQTIWLSPIYPSPMVDFGYDISDFMGIHPDFGTMEDFDNMLATAHTLGMKIVMDFVPGHSSDQHEWFPKSANREPGFENFYVWKNASGVDSAGNPLPPNNWTSVFYGSAWEWNEARQQFYLHQFAKEQPDLNYREPLLVEEMKNVIRFWLGKGVDGLRMDAVAHLFEDASFLDEPYIGGDPLSTDSYNHIYMLHQDETYDMVQQWREVSDAIEAQDGVSRVLFVEAYAGITETMRYYGTEERPGAHFPFNFNLIRINSNFTAQDFKRQIDDWMDNMPTGRTANWVIGNHDQRRISTRFAKDMKDAMNMLSQLLPGVGVTYYGEEIGMEDNEAITWAQGQDPQGCNYPQDMFYQKSRDFERTPFQWDDTVNAGFNTGAEPWLPVNSNYVTLNLAAETTDTPFSHYSIYKDLQRARKTTAIQEGSFNINTVGENILTFMRGTSSENFFVVVMNFDLSDTIVDLDQVFLIGSARQLTVYTASENAGLVIGSTVTASSVPVRGRSSAVLSFGQTL